MGWVMAFLAIPLTFFVVFIVPIWLWFHYRGKQAGQAGLTQQDIQRLGQLTREAQTMRERIETLESILDSEQPGWRNR